MPETTTIGIEALAKELAKRVRAGLPFDYDTAGDVLPNLRSVGARSIHSDDRASRIDALNLLLPRLIGAIPEQPHGRPARILFKLEAGTGGLTLTKRRQKIAGDLKVDPDHFRKKIEPKVLQTVALAILADLRKYRPRSKRAMAAMEPTGDTPALRATDHIRLVFLLHLN